VVALPATTVDHLSTEAGSGSASFVISLDTELAWGSLHRGGYAGRRRLYERTRSVVDAVLGMFEQYEISATWAVVGHLMRGFPGDHVESVSRDNNGLLGSAISEFADSLPSVPHWGRDDVELWYAPDIVKRIANCPVRQEIGSHTFTHAIVSGDPISRQRLREELKACRGLAQSWGVELRSFVYPRNSIAHLDMLSSAGFTSYRGLSPSWGRDPGAPLERLKRLAGHFLVTCPPVAWPSFSTGLVNVPATYEYPHRSGWGRWLPIGFRVRRALKGLRQAAATGSIFHLWTHPFNLADDPDGLLSGLVRIFREYRVLRDSGLILSRTMSDVASMVTV